jgi:hypothetical protein
MGKVLQSFQLIIWEECAKAHKKALEALNRTLKDLRGYEQLFGGTLKLYQLYHDQHPLMSLMHVLNHHFYGDTFRN